MKSWLTHFWKTWFWSIPLVLFLAPFVPFIDYGYDWVRIEGTVLQLVGVLFVFLGLNDKLKYFGGKSFLDMTRDWFQKFLGKGKNQVVMMAGFAAGSSMGKAVIRAGFGPSMSVDEKIAYLKTQIENVETRTVKIEEKFDGLISGIEKKIESTKGELLSEIKKTSDGIGRLFIDGFRIEVFGAFLILIGIPYTSIPDLMIKLFELTK